MHAAAVVAPIEKGRVGMLLQRWRWGKGREGGRVTGVVEGAPGQLLSCRLFDTVTLLPYKKDETVVCHSVTHATLIMQQHAQWSTDAQQRKIGLLEEHTSSMQHVTELSQKCRRS